MHVIFIENQSRLSNYLKRVLSAEALTVFNIQDYDSLKHYLNSGEYPEPDVIVLDQDAKEQTISKNLPHIKSSHPNIKVIALAEIEGPKERVRLLELGADDCMTKPIDIEELLVRIRRLYGRDRQSVTITLPSEVQLNLDARDLEFRGRRIKLNNKEFHLAETFLGHPGKVFSRVILFDLVWGIQADVESNVVEVTVSNLRKKIEASGCPLYIKSRRNVGYWLEF